MQKNADCYERTPTGICSTFVSLGNKFVILWTFQITANELEFWMTDQVKLDQLKLQVDEKLYPPRFQVAVGGNITENVLTKFSFKGAMETLNGVVLLETSGITLSPL